MGINMIRCASATAGKFFAHSLASMKDPNRSYSDDGKSRRKKKIAVNPLLDDPDSQASGKAVRAALGRFVQNFLSDAYVAICAARDDSS